MKLQGVIRKDENVSTIPNENNLDITLYANKDVDIEQKVVDQVLEFSNLKKVISNLKEVGYLRDPEIMKISLAPDLHRGDGEGTPIGTSMLTRGFIIPKIPGNDLGCSVMNVGVDINSEELAKIPKKEINAVLRRIYFEGDREVITSPEIRKAFFEEGLNSLKRLNLSKGIWKYLNLDYLDEKVFKFCQVGSYELFKDYVNNPTDRDTQLGSIGGGNHFVEWQEVVSSKWNQYGIQKGKLNIMAHTGSVSIGSAIFTTFEVESKKDYPKGIKAPFNNFYPLDSESELGKKYLSAMNGAINFSQINRLILILMSIKALEELLKRKVKYHVAFDSLHNWIETKEDNTFLHRKGSCPCYKDDLVAIPGSMGSPSFLLLGDGKPESNYSGPHGAGRLRRRGEARNKSNAIPAELFVVTKLPDFVPEHILKEFNKSIAEEAPGCYKDVLPAVKTVEDSNIAHMLAEVKPFLTIKGI